MKMRVLQVLILLILPLADLLAQCTGTPYTPNVTIATATGASNGCSSTAFGLVSNVTGSAAGTVTYQWFLDGVLLPGATSQVYNYPGGNVGDSVTCVIYDTNPCATVATDTSNFFIINIQSVTPAIAISTSTNTICAGANVLFISAASSTGSSPTRQWYKNGILIPGATSNSYSTTTLTNGDVISAIMVSSLSTCITKQSDTSNFITMTVNPSVVPNINISSPNAAGCSGGNITFSSAISNGGTSPTYSWRVNGVQVGTGNSYASTSLVNGDVVTCILTSNAFCAIPNKDTAATITVNISPIVTPSVVISVDQNPVCASSNINFTAVPTNGGTAPTYSWRVNGVPVVGATSDTWSTAFLNNGDVVTCVLFTSEPCATTGAAVSNSIAMNTTFAFTPSVSISAAPSNIVCAGIAQTFTATWAYGGTNPTFQWKVNGIIQAGVTGNVFSPAAGTINTGSLVQCVLTSDYPCVTAATASSNNVPVIIKPLVTPTVSAFATDDTICIGENVFFTSAATIAGSSPIYQWKLNGTNVGTNATLYNTSNFTLGTNTVTVNMTSNSNQCLSDNPVNSANVIVYVKPLVKPQVSLSASANNVCFGTPITFNTTDVNAGNAPSYNWLINGVSVASGAADSLVSFNLFNGDVVQVVLSSNEDCVNPMDTGSNSITMQIKPLVLPTISITSDTNAVCDENTIVFSIVSESNQGTTPTYQWQVNGINMANATGNTYTTDSLLNGDLVTVLMTSSVECPSPKTVASNPVNILIYPPATPNVNIASSDTDICIATNILFTTTLVDEGSAPQFKWFWNGLQHGANANAYSNILLEDLDFVYCVMTSNAPCLTKESDTSNTIIMKVDDNVSPTLTISQSVSSAGVGAPINYTASTPVLPPYTIQWYRNGSVVTTTSGNVWSTTVATVSDSVYGVIVGFKGCYLANSATSNGLKLSPANITNTAPINFGIYPNPTDGLLQLSGVQKGDKLSVYDMSGKLIHASTIVTDLQGTLDMSSYASGIYQVKFVRNEQVWMARVSRK
jgi:hypothetical protein